jgi:hypothetical protein
MKEDKDLISVYSGTEASALLLKKRLEMIGISSMIKRDSKAGTWGAVADNIDLFIETADKREARPVIETFMHTDKVEKL